MGICGTGVGALAGMLQSQGYTVTGSDQNVYPPMSDFLTSLGIEIMSGYHPKNLEKRPDLVIVGNVVTRLNEEAIALADMELPYLSMPQALSHFFIGKKTSLVVSGTHGKTTTSSMLATMLHFAGLDPGFMIGGIVQEFSQNFLVSNGEFFVIEGDEYDTAFFDKGPKFLHYKPHIAILTSIEFDHADIYANLEEIKTSFTKLAKIIPQDGLLIANFDDPVVREIAAHAKCQVMGYGTAKELPWSLQRVQVTPNGTTFSVLKNSHFYGDFTTRMPGHHNAMNSLAVIAALDRIGISATTCSKSLVRFSGVRRRQEVRGVADNITVIDDFAHHPTAVKETLKALRQAYPAGRLIAVFEPRTNSSRRDIFQNDYVTVFSQADNIIIKDPIPLSDIAENERFSAPKLVHDLSTQGLDAKNFCDSEKIIEHLVEFCKAGDVVAIMSNGGFDNIHSKLLKKLQIRENHA